MPRADQTDIPKDILRGIAITTLIFTISVYLPLVGFIAALFLPLPTLFYRSKLGRTVGASVPVAAIVVMVVMIGGFSIDLLYFFELLLLGFVLSELFEKDLSVEKTVLYACGSVALAGIVCLFFYSLISHTAVMDLVSEYVAQNLKNTLAIYKEMGVAPENIQMISNSLENIHYVLLRIIPAVALAGTTLVAWSSLLLARPMLTRRQLFYPAFGRLNRWKAPEHLIWGIIASGLLLLLPPKGLKVLGLNGLLVLMTVYFFQGIAIVSFFFEDKKIPRGVRFFLYGLIAIQQVILLVVIGLGIFDMWLNFRKLEVAKKSQPS